MSADTTQENLPNTENGSQSKGNHTDAELASVKAQLAELIEANRTIATTLVEQRRQAEIPTEEENLFDPQTLLRKTEALVEARINTERSTTAKIAEMSREYPEINSDTKLMQAVVNELKALPSSIQQTADGYEVAILKAVNKAGIVPRSRRQAVDEDVSMGNRGGGTQGREKKTKLSQNSMDLAELMGLNTSDPEVVKRLEKRAQRSRWNKYE
jgi:hypothetical protein